MAWIDLSLPLEECDFFVRLVKLGKARGAVIPNDDGTYSMYLNVDDPLDVQTEAYWHEYKHLACCDFDNGRPIEDIER